MEIKSSADGTVVKYRLFVPKIAQRTTEALPLVVVLHGRGANQNSWLDLTPIKKGAEQFGYILAAPCARDTKSWATAKPDVFDVIANVCNLVFVDRNRIYLAGHSMGGNGTWLIGLSTPDLFAAICPMSGYMKDCPPLENARGLSPLIIHGSADDVVLPIESRRPAQNLARLGISFQYREEIGIDHSAHKLIQLNQSRMFEWFNKHPRQHSVSPEESRAKKIRKIAGQAAARGARVRLRRNSK